MTVVKNIENASESIRSAIHGSYNDDMRISDLYAAISLVSELTRRESELLPMIERILRKQSSEKSLRVDRDSTDSADELISKACAELQTAAAQLLNASECVGNASEHISHIGEHVN